MITLSTNYHIYYWYDLWKYKAEELSWNLAYFQSLKTKIKAAKEIDRIYNGYWFQFQVVAKVEHFFYRIRMLFQLGFWRYGGFWGYYPMGGNNEQRRSA